MGDPNLGSGLVDPGGTARQRLGSSDLSDHVDIGQSVTWPDTGLYAEHRESDDDSFGGRIDDVLQEHKSSVTEGVEVSRDGAVWTLGLDNERTKQLTSLLKGGSPVAAPLGPVAVAGLAAGAEYINLINDLGGNNGVELIGAVGTTGFICTPRFSGILQQAATLAKVGISGRTIMDLVIRAASLSPPLAQALQIPVVATIFAEVAKGTPLGWALAIGVGVIEKIFEGAEPDINDHGAVHANRDLALEWESFLLGRVDDDHVALLSWQGLLSAQMGGGHGVYANRVEVGEWETWRLIDNRDGTVSLQTFDGHWLCAEEGGGRECQANRTEVGEWEKFVLEELPGGKVALRTKALGKYLSVQQNS